MLDKLLITLIHKSSEVLFLVSRLAISVNQLEYSLLNWENAFKRMFPEIFLLSFGYTAALLVTYLDNLA